MTFKYKNTEFGYPYEIILESKGIDSPTELKIQVDDNLINKLPEKMITELTERFYEFIQE